MKYLVLAALLLTSCIRKEQYSIDDIYNMKEKCGKIASYMKQPFEFHKENGSYLCFVKRSESRIVFWPEELSAVNRFIAILGE
jgi:hypothetical protein